MSTVIVERPGGVRNENMLHTLQCWGPHLLPIPHKAVGWRNYQKHIPSCFLGKQLSRIRHPGLRRDDDNFLGIVNSGDFNIDHSDQEAGLLAGG